MTRPTSRAMPASAGRSPPWSAKWARPGRCGSGESCERRQARRWQVSASIRASIPSVCFAFAKSSGVFQWKILRRKLESGEIEQELGLRMALHVRQGLTETHAMLLYRADDLRAAVEEFLISACGVRRAEVAGECRRRVGVVEELV